MREKNKIFGLDHVLLAMPPGAVVQDVWNGETLAVSGCRVCGVQIAPMTGRIFQQVS